MSFVYSNAYLWSTNVKIYKSVYTSELLNEDDLEIFTTERNGKKLTHVRLPLEPYAFGSAPLTGTCSLAAAVEPISQPNPDPNHAIAQENYVALVNDIKLLTENKTAVVLDCHPIFLAQPHLNAFVSGLGYNGTTRTDWPGPWRKDFVLAPGGVVSAQHPLVNYWRSFLTNLWTIWQMEYPFEEFPEDVYFELMNEPLANLTENDLGVTYTANMRRRARRDWRNIQKQVINTIWGEFPQFKPNRIIATDGEFLSREQHPQFEVDPPPPFPDRPTGFTDWNGLPILNWYFTPYQQSEILNGETNAQYNIIYTFHQYSPYPVTHSFQLYTGNPSPLYPPLFPIDRTISDWDHVRNGLTPVEYWRLAYGGPPVYFGEFGVKISSDNGLEPPPSNDPIIGRRESRARWLYDNRIDIENAGEGWCAFDYISTGFGIFTGRFQYTYSGEGLNRGHRINGSGGRGPIESFADQALFGSTRP